jgi:hypothetical protein
MYFCPPSQRSVPSVYCSGKLFGQNCTEERNTPSVCREPFLCELTEDNEGKGPEVLRYACISGCQSPEGLWWGFPARMERTWRNAEESPSLPLIAGAHGTTPRKPRNEWCEATEICTSVYRRFWGAVARWRFMTLVLLKAVHTSTAVAWHSLNS